MNVFKFKRYSKMIAVVAMAFLYLFLLAEPVLVRADVVMTPMNDFYMKHSEECDYDNNTYVAKTEVDVYSEPNGLKSIDVLAAGTNMVFEAVYTENGVKWGLGFTLGDEGWMRLDHFDIVYSSYVFKEKFANQIIDEDVVLGCTSQDTIRLWTCPASKDSYESTIPNGEISMSSVFTDSKGIRWGNIGYYCGIRDVWVAIDYPKSDLDELYNGEIPSELVEANNGIVTDQNSDKGATDSLEEPSDETSENPSEESEHGVSPFLIIFVLIALLVGCCGFLLFYLYKK